MPEELLTGVFGGVIESQSVAPGEDAQITQYHSDHVAVVEDPDLEQPALLESLLPLRTTNEQGQKEAVNLDLARSDGELRPENPLVEVGVPLELGEGIALPSAQVEIFLRDAPEEREPSTISPSTVFYPNVATDTDLSVSPTAAGLETSTQIRSAEAPKTETFDLRMPPDAILRENEEGGAEIVQGGETRVSIERPKRSGCCAGKPIPVTLVASDHAITLRVEPDTGAVYPILVDPVYEAYFQSLNHSTEGTADWVPATNSPLFQPTPLGHYGEAELNIYSLAGPVAPGSQANWNYHVPRFYTDQVSGAHEKPTSYIQSMTLTDLRWWFEEPGPPFPGRPIASDGALG